MDNDPSKDVYFDGCKLWTIPSDLFFKVRTLQKTYLNLSNNHLIEIENQTNSLSDLGQVQKKSKKSSIFVILAIYRFLNQLKAGIHHFDISNNCLGEIPNGINSLSSLTHLNISNNFIQHIPISLFNLTQGDFKSDHFDPLGYRGVRSNFFRRYRENTL